MNSSRKTLLRWMKFNAVGAIGIGVQLGVLTLLTSCTSMNYLIATAVAVEAAVLHNYFWHERFTWSDRRGPTSVRRLWKFNLTTGICSIAGNLLFTGLLVNSGMGYLAANAAAIAICSISNFVLSDRMVFVMAKALPRASPPQYVCARRAAPKA